MSNSLYPPSSKLTMNPNTKSQKRVWAYLNPEDAERLSGLESATGLDPVTILSVLASAGLKALQAKGNRVELPLSLYVGSPEEPSPRARSVTPHPLKK